MKIKEYIPQSFKNIYHLFVALLVNIVYGFPARKLKVIGVTGTDGKTTTASLIYAIIKEAGYNVGLVTSIRAEIREEVEDTGFHVTSPDPAKLQKFLRKMVAAGCEYAVLEVTSHGLDQHRFFGINFDIGVLTNITHEHLDYHKTYEDYVEAKAKLFKKVKYSVLNCDDSSFNLISKKKASGKIISYALNNKADIKPRIVESAHFSQIIGLEDYQIKAKLLGKYNVYNILAAIAAAYVLNIPKEAVKQAIENFNPLPGRFELIDRGQEFTVVVDFAHTPKALEEVIRFGQEFLEIKPSTELVSAKAALTDSPTPGVGKGSVIVVFGCAGLRDIKKRPKMGEIACRLADITVLTAEDPRTEDVNDIIEQISEGCLKVGGIEGKTFFKVSDRKEAIGFAINKLAKRGDLVIITGKGHEKSMCFGTKEYPWSDQEVVKEVLRSKFDKKVG